MPDSPLFHLAKFLRVFLEEEAGKEWFTRSEGEVWLFSLACPSVEQGGCLRASQSHRTIPFFFFLSQNEIIHFVTDLGSDLGVRKYLSYDFNL